MKKSQKWILFSTMIGLMIIIPTIFITISGISIKEIPLWIPIVFFGLTFIPFLVQPKVSGFPLRKRRKMLLILLGIYIVFLLIMTVIKGMAFLKVTNITSLIQYLLFIVVFLYGFFRKDKEAVQKDETKMNN